MNSSLIIGPPPSTFPIPPVNQNATSKISAKLIKENSSDNMDKWLSPVFKNLLIENEFSDCCVIVGTKKFDCHKVILSSASDYFKRIFLGNFKESTSSEVHLEDITPEIFEYLRLYIYTYDSNVLKEYNNDDLRQLLICSKRFLIPSLDNACISIILVRIPKMMLCDVMQFYEYSNTFMDKELEVTITKKLKDTWSESLKCYEALNLSPPVFEKFVDLTSGILSEFERFKMIEFYIDIHDEWNGKNDGNINTELKIDDKSNVDDDDDDENKSKISNDDEVDSKFDEELEKPNEKNNYIKKLLQKIVFCKMTKDEIFNGPGKSHLIDGLYDKYALLYNCKPEAKKNEYI